MTSRFDTDTTRTDRKYRRRFLQLIGATGLTTFLAGCLGDDDDVQDDETDDTDDEIADEDDQPQGALFEVSNFDGDGLEVPIGEPIEVSGTVENSGDETDVVNVEYRIDDEEVDSTTTPIDAGDSELVEFQVDSDDLDLGEHTHSIYADGSEVSGTLTITGILVELAEHDQYVEVAAEGQTLNEYRWDYEYGDEHGQEYLQVPAFWHMYSPGDGARVTRRFPLDQEGPDTGHPHQIGLAFAYGAVDGIDYWNNRDQDSGGMGSVLLGEVETADDGNPAMLEVSQDWRDNDADTIQLAEEATMGIQADDDFYTIDRLTTLEAQSDLDLGDHQSDSQEGLFGIRARQELNLDDSATYLSSTGIQADSGSNGDPVWGGRYPWVRLHGDTEDGDTICLVLMDHPENVGAPSHWHARGYGLFSVNNLGGLTFSNDHEDGTSDPDAQPGAEIGFTMNGGERVTFKHRFICANRVLEPGEIDDLYDDFLDDVTTIADNSAFDHE